MDQRKIDKQDRRNSIDTIIENDGKRILEFIQEYGVLVEFQFYLSQGIFERELEYFEEKLATLGLPVYLKEEEEFEDEEEYLPRLSCKFHKANSELNEHFYYVIYNGHLNTTSKESAEETAIQVFKNEVQAR